MWLDVFVNACCLLWVLVCLVIVYLCLVALGVLIVLFSLSFIFTCVLVGVTLVDLWLFVVVVVSFLGLCCL